MEGSEHILALNKHGVHFLDLITHETILHYPFTEVISTRQMETEDGVLYLDMKCGNLMQQRISRIQTDQAVEIARLIKQYITIGKCDPSSTSCSIIYFLSPPRSRVLFRPWRSISIDSLIVSFKSTLASSLIKPQNDSFHFSDQRSRGLNVEKDPGQESRAGSRLEKYVL